MTKVLKNAIFVAALAVIFAVTVVLGAIVFSRPQTDTPAAVAPSTYIEKHGDQQLAYLLVKLLLKTRAVMRDHYARSQSDVPGVDPLYKRWMAKNLILPAAVADQVFFEVVPGATGGRAWVKMVVENPRNPHNRGDSVALELLSTIQTGKSNAERSTENAYYYAEPIKATALCRPCHGEPRGEPDPLFPQFQKDGWRDGETIGAVVARIEPEK